MTSRVTPGRLIIPNENLGMTQKKFSADGNGKSSKIIHKKGIAGSGRKALNDITNKSSCRQDAPLRKQERAKEEIDVGGERFLHDHDKCVDARKATMSAFYLDLLLPGHDSLSKVGCHTSDQAKIDVDAPQCYPDPDELFIPELPNWSKYLAKQQSPPRSPLRWDFPSTSFSCQFEELNFVLTHE
ncbi:protein PATRONUS 1-like isoform X2 [Cucurbita moschata]|nr:protein PATRONUS 1-like isoform X2 [Cucurbita moschata]XP_022928587.1 protein PATRONUS 1-like isoform X2 [Cucurbita moschata]